MTQRRTALSRAARARASWITVAIVAVAAGPACKPSSTKITMGPFTGDRYESTAPDGSALSCFVFAGETSRPVRLCGDGGPIAGYAGVQFEAVAPAPDAKFISAIGQPLDPGTWILRSTGGTSVDAWGLGRLAGSLWLGSGKLLFALDSGRPTKIRLLDPAARTERVLDPGPTTSEAFLLVRAPDDKAVLMVTRAGADDLVLVRDPLGNADVFTSDAGDETLPGNRKLSKHAEQEHQHGSIYKPTIGVFSWNGADPLFEGSPLGPFNPVPNKH